MALFANFMHNQPLKTEVLDGRLVISIGIETLAWASRPENYGPLTDCEVEAGREEEWAKDVARQIDKEDETGDTPLNRFLDKMMVAASENGSGAIIFANAQEHLQREGKA